MRYKRKYSAILTSALQLFEDIFEVIPFSAIHFWYFFQGNENSKGGRIIKHAMITSVAIHITG